MSSTRTNAHSDERGIALVMTLLVMMLMTALLVGFTTIIRSDQRFRFIDHDRSQAFYAASGGMEKLTADLGTLFLKFVAPTNAQMTALTATASIPTINNVTFVATAVPTALTSSELSTFHCYSTAASGSIPAVNRAVVTVGGNGYALSFCANTATNNPTTNADPTTIISGNYAGLYGLKTPFQLDVTAKTSTGGEVHLIRSVEAVSIPVFQFGIFSDVDLAFNAADDFSFGGRVHTNGNLFLSQAASSTLTLSDKVTAFKEVIRQQLSNGQSIDANSDTGTVNMAKGGGAFTAMDRTWGSVTGGPLSPANEPTWSSVSIGTYKKYITNWRTGVKQLNLPLIAVGGKNTDLVRRPLVGEDTSGVLFNERLFSKASLRVMLSDTPDDIKTLPTIDTTVDPVSLEGSSVFGSPIATSPGLISTTISSVSSSGSGSNKLYTLTLPSIPTFFQVGPVSNAANTITATSGIYTFTITACNAKTATQLSNCTVAVTPAGGTLPNGANLNVVVNGVTVSSALSGNGSAIAAGTGKPIKVVSTAGFSPQTFWVDDNVVTCTTYDASVGVNQFSNCKTAVAPPSGHAVTTFALSPAGTSLLGGYIKIEQQSSTTPGTWRDVTQQVLTYGIGAPSQSGSCDASATDPSPNAIIRLERLHDSGDPGGGNCTPTAGASKYDFWPNALFDGREAWQRDTEPAGINIKIGGIMNYVEIDAANLAKWFAHAAPYNTAGDTGNASLTDNSGYSIYVSDRRNNRDTNSKETAEYGWEDFVNPLSTTAAANGTLDLGEDVNQNTTLETYGGVPNCNGVYNQLGPVTTNGVTVTCANALYTTAFRPTTDIVTSAETTFDGVGRAMVNRPVIFRRAVKLIHGSNLVANVTGFTAVTENPVYVQGDWNVSSCSGAITTTAAHAATAIIGDAVTVMSGNWSDAQSFQSPYAASATSLEPGRDARPANSCYRMAILAGKGVIFPWISGTSATFGTDGGAHSFIRFLEDKSTNDSIRYRGSMTTFYYSQQAVGVFKGTDGVVYGIPSLRDYQFDTDFQTPSLLPPLTPMFRDINAIGFSQELRPNR